MGRRRAIANESAHTIQAVAYLRMSTAMQPSSLAGQATTIEAYAQAHGYEIIGTYEDAAISGVDAKTRPAFRQLLATVLAGGAAFEVILVYDVSRWGRFQDPDEAAHYEFLCAQEGVRIEYCAEAFGDGHALHDALMKGLKRAMAAEYSRELGAKISQAQARLSAKGHWQHGPPGYGLRRRLVSATGELGAILEDGERKADPRQHTILVRGPTREVETIRRMHVMCGQGRLNTYQIAAILNDEGALAPRSARWSGERVRQILTNPKYAGQLVTGKRHTPLGGKRVTRPKAMWIIANGAAPALVSKKAFAATQAALTRAPSPETDQLLDVLRSVAREHGVVSEPRLRELGVAHHRAYRQRFGSLRAAFRVIGHEPGRRFPKVMDDAAMLKGLAKLFERCGDITCGLIDGADDLPSADHYRVRFGSLSQAYARIGFVRIGGRRMLSAVSRARLEARRVRVSAWATRR